MTAKRFILRNDTIRANCADWALIHAPDGWMVTFSEPVKSRIEESKYHAMISDISKQMTFMGKKRDLESWKRLLIESFVTVMRDTAKAQDKPDPFPDQSEVLPSLDGQRIVQLGVQSRKFTVKIAAEFIEYLLHYGAENNVVWTEKNNLPEWVK
jgi:hypothetical protein